MELISLPAQIREHHKKYLAGECDHRDVLVVAHGHFNRVLISRWIRFPLSIGMILLDRIASLRRLTDLC
jgi:broad specificity phosphatase PhoE